MCTTYVGSAKQASDYITVSSFLLNHVRRTFNKGQDIADAIENEQEIDFSKEAPAPLKTSASEKKEDQERETLQFGKQFEVECALHSKRVQQCRDNEGAAAATLWNQCSNVMKSKIQSRKDYDTNVKGDPTKLLQA